MKIETLHQFLICDPIAGRLFWRERTQDVFAQAIDPDRACRSWNTRFAGKEAIASEGGSHGYRDGAVLAVPVLAHRVIFAMVHGRWPVGIDHINGNRRDNRIENLREADQSLNLRNAKLRRDNPNGVPGVYQAPSGRWIVKIAYDGASRYLGTFDTLDLATAVRRAAELDHGYHQNHGRAA
jgi:hypothetical protein